MENRGALALIKGFLVITTDHCSDLHWGSKRGQGTIPQSNSKKIQPMFFVMEQKKLASNDAKCCTRLHLRVLKYSKISQRGGVYPLPLTPLRQAGDQALQLAPSNKNPGYASGD